MGVSIIPPPASAQSVAPDPSRELPVRYNQTMRTVQFVSAAVTIAMLAVPGASVASEPTASGEAERVDLRRAPFGPHVPGTNVSAGLEPVDRAVGDLDALSHSLRHVDPGAARFPDHVRVYRLHDDAPGMWSQLGDPARDRAQRDQRHTYRYEAPGVRAWVRRPAYLVRGGPNEPPLAVNRPPQQEGELLELVPADTVFDLIPPHRQAAPEPEPDAVSAEDHRIDYRVDTRIGTRVDTRTDGDMDGDS